MNYLSDHCLVITDISISETFEKEQLDLKYEWKNLPSIFLWNNTSPEVYKEALSSPQLKDDINTFLTESFPGSSIGVEKANNLSTNIMCRAAKLSLGTKTVKQYKTRKPKKNGSTKTVKRQENYLSNQLKLPTKTLLMFFSMKRDLKNLKSSKKIVKNNKQNFGKKEMMS